MPSISKGSVNCDRLGFKKAAISAEVFNPLLISICAKAGEIEAVAERYFMNSGLVLLTNQRLCTADRRLQGSKASRIRGEVTSNPLLSRFISPPKDPGYFLANSLFLPHRSTTGLATKIEE
jgi:hypothetical protein